MSRVFVDTNILAYRFDAGDPDRQERARRALGQAEHEFVVSTQVMLELYVVLTRKLRPPVPAAAAEDALTELAALPVVAADAVLVRRAASTAGVHRMSIWDAMIIEAAHEAACDEIWTEDLAPGSTLRGVRITNPLAVE